jgi:capsular exopolysaccharide synthesis family protein
MSGQQVQVTTDRESGAELAPENAPATSGDWEGTPSAEEGGGVNVTRYLSAINRFKWLVVGLSIVGAAAGYLATEFIAPEYEVRATILLEQGTGTANNGRGPIQAAELLRASGWLDLLRSFAIADPVVTDLGLFVTPSNAADSAVFKNFRVNQQQLRPGDYELKLAKGRYELYMKLGVRLEKGAVGDSIGRTLGFQWAPSAQQFSSRTSVSFNVQTPREASQELIRRLGLTLQDGSSFLFLRLTGDNAPRTAATLNAWVEQFVTVATALKKKNITSVATILEGQREFAAKQLNDAESSLQGFRVRTVTEPSERPTIQPGLDMTTSPVYENYFRDKLIAENYRRDREALAAISEKAKAGGAITREAVLSIPAVNADPAADNLRRILAELGERENVLRRLRETFTDEYQKVRDEEAALRTLRTTTVPLALDGYLGQLRIREQTLTATIERAGKDLREIPSRSIEEQRLKRQVDVNADMYKNLNLKAAEAKLAEAATIPDVSVLDAAVAPLRPTKNTAPVIILGAFGVGLVLGLVLAVLLDQLDRRFRYPEQATKELGLFILGVVPVIGSKRKRSQIQEASQVVEAFRTIRMNVRYAADPGRPLVMTITSPGPNDGKSLISSNLALSFAESGARTLIIDGDIRRGELARTFDVSAKPGLVEYLDGTALIAEVLHPVAAHPNLSLMPAGARRRRAPELLATPRLNQLVNQMAGEYDVIVIDSPPLGAGFDAYALAIASGNMALVLRAGVTDRKMAAAKMAIVHTLPVRVMGSVLNGIKLTGVYEYYSYYQEYAARDEDTPAELTQGSSAGRHVLTEGD